MYTHPSPIGSHTRGLRGLRSPPLSARRILKPGEPGETSDVEASVQTACDDGTDVAPSIPPPCSLLRLCVLLSPHRSVLQDGREEEEEERVGGGGRQQQQRQE